MNPKIITRAESPFLFAKTLLGVTLFPWQLEWLESRARVKVACCGRRAGKSYAEAIDLIWFATVNDESTQFVIAPTIDQARIIFGYCVKLLFASPILSKFAKPPVLSPFPKIELLNGSTIHARGSGQTASDSHLGGHGADRIIADEAAFIPHSILAEVIPPMLAASLYGELCLISTPFGLNHFYEAWQRGQRGEDGCASFNFSSWANPKLEPAYLESQRAVVLAVRRQVLTKHRGLVRAQSSMLAKSSRIWCIPCGLWRQCDEAPAATGQLTGSQQDRIVRAFTRRKLQRHSNGSGSLGLSESPGHDICSRKRSTPMPSTEELWEAVQKQGNLVAAQQKEIEALKRRHLRAPVARRALLASATIIGVLALSGAVYAASPSPISANILHACYSVKTRAVVVAKGSVCPNGMVAVAWNQFTAITASRPLTVTQGVKGSAPSVALTGTVPTARNFSGSLNGDVSGTQSKTQVGAIQGVPVSTTTPSSNQVLGFDGSEWGPVGVYNPLQVALLQWYPANRTGMSVTVGTQPSGVAFDGSHIWVSNQGGGTVSEISDSASPSVINTVTVGGNPGGMAFDGSHIWVGNTSGTVSEIDVATHSVINTVTVGGDPVGVAFDGSHIWVSNLGGSTVSEISDTASPSVINTVTVGSGPFEIAFDGSHIWVTNVGSKTVSEISDTASPSVVNTVTVGTRPEGVAFDGSHIWVVNYGSGTVSEISDTASPIVIKTVTVGSGPFSASFDGSHVWVSNESGGTVSEISDTASPSIINTITVGKEPGGVAFDGSHIWVANFGDGTVSIL